MPLSASQKCCLAAIAVSFLLCLTADVSPYWEYLPSDDPLSSIFDIEIGLIFGCYKTAIEHECKVIEWDLSQSDMTYYQAIRVVMWASLLFHLMSAITALVMCCKRQGLHSINSAGVLALVAGFVGIAGVITFAACTKGENKIALDIVGITLAKGWAFYLAAAGNSLVLLLGLSSFFLPKNNYKLWAYPSTLKEGYSNPGYRAY